MASASITSTRCSVCGHAERLTIDNLLATGAEARAVARRFGLSKSAVSRHLHGHISETWMAAMKVGPYGSQAELAKLCAEEGISVVQGLRALYASHHAMLVANREAGATNAYITVAREIRATLNDIGRITGELLPSVANVNITNNFNTVNYLAALGEELVQEFGDDIRGLERVHRVLQRRMASALPAPDLIEGEAAHAA
jgi:hypothetical protein